MTMTETKTLACNVEVGDVVLVGIVPIGSMSLTSGKFKRANGGAYDEERRVVAVEHGFDDGWPKDWDGDVTAWGPQPTVFLTYEGKEHLGPAQYAPDDLLRIKEGK